MKQPFVLQNVEARNALAAGGTLCIHTGTSLQFAKYKVCAKSAVIAKKIEIPELLCIVLQAWSGTREGAHPALISTCKLLATRRGSKLLALFLWNRP